MSTATPAPHSTAQETPRPRVLKAKDRDGRKSGKGASAPPEAAPARTATWVDRFVRRELEDPAQLLGNDLNWRGHPRYQQMAMIGVLETLGWLDEVKVNINTGRVFNGHMRCEIAISKGEPVPTSYYDLTEEEERMALATFDPLASLAFVASKENYDALADLPGVAQAADGLQKLVAHMAGRGNIQAAYETNFLSGFLDAASAEATTTAGAQAPGAAPGASGNAPESVAGAASVGDGQRGTAPGLPGSASLVEAEHADPSAAAVAEYLKVVFAFLPHQKRALFDLINRTRKERALGEATQSEILLILLGVPLSDDSDTAS